MDDSASIALKEAREAFERGDFEAADRAYCALDEAGGLTAPEDLLRHLKTSMMMGQNVRALRAGERAFSAWECLEDIESAARAALWLLRIRMDRSEYAIGMSWLRCAERLLEDAPPCTALADLRCLQSFLAQLDGKLENALDIAVEAERIAREAGAESELALALSRRGRVLIRLGRLQEAEVLLDEAMASVTAGKVDAAASFIVYCSTIDACTDLADYDRASQWTDAASDWCTSGRFQGTPGICRVHRAEMLRIRGDLQMAEREAKAACEMLERAAMISSAAEGMAELGMIRLQTGDLDGADAAFTEAHARGHEPQPGLALLRLARGNVAGAKTSISRALAEHEGDPLRRAKLLPAQVTIFLEDGDVKTADSAASELETIAARFATPGLIAASLAQRGAVRLAEDDVAGAITILRRALGAWNKIGAPYEVARIRQLLAKAHEQEGDADQAALERRASRRTLEVLGAPFALARTELPARDAAETSAPGSATVGTVIDGKIRLVRLLGEGAMGAVFEAVHEITGRAVAVKMVHEALCGRAEHCQRLLQEARACGRIRHPNVIDVYDAGMHGGVPYLVLELLEGRTLAEHLSSRQVLEPREAVAIVCQVLDGLQAAHDGGIVHRDLKPANVFLATGPDSDGPQVKVLDFGISKLATDAIAKTQTGAILGTPYYMAPEQIQSEGDVDARADVYSAAAVLYELLMGEPPFIATTYAALLMKIVRDPFPSARIRNSAVPEALDAIIQRAGSREAEKRFASAAELAGALRGVGV